MRLVVLAVGSLGDVRPFVAVAAGLARRGYTVALATHETFRGLALEQGLAFEPIAGNPRDIVRGADGQDWLESADRPWEFMRSLSRIAGPILDSLSSDAWRAAQGCDAIIYSLPLAASGYTVAEALGVPGIPAALYPLHPTGAFPSILNVVAGSGSGQGGIGLPLKAAFAPARHVRLTVRLPYAPGE